MADNPGNLILSTVATAPSPATSGTTLVVATGDGAIFAQDNQAIIWPSGVTPTRTNAEIVRITNVATDTLTIVRAQEGTSAKSIAVGYQIMVGLTQRMFAIMNGWDTDVVDFGAEEDHFASVTTLTGVISPKPRVWVDPVDTAALGDHSADEVAAEGVTAYLLDYTTPTYGSTTSCTIGVSAPNGTWGRYAVYISAL
jgi:hypothetical protein